MDHNIVPSDLDSYWMPLTASRSFKKHPRFIVGANGMYYKDSQGNEVLDVSAGLWCVNAGHYREKINDAIAEQLKELDFAHSFNSGHPHAFRFASRLVEHFPDPLNHVFFTNSGSESVDTALKIALAYQQHKGEGTRQRLIGREKAYHGMGFGGISVGGLVKNRQNFGQLLPGTDHIRHTLDIERNAFSRGLPAHGAELAEDLLRLVDLHAAENIAAVIVEPVAGAGGVILPPEGYLQRLRDICTANGILLIFDEVITAFGRLGAASAAERFGVIPDIITTAKGITNATIPMGGVFVSDEIYNTFMSIDEPGVELSHGYTYSGHPVACAAGMATLDIYEEEQLFSRAQTLSDHWMESALSLQGEPNVIDVRTLPLIGAIELSPREGAPMQRGVEVGQKCYEKGAWVRNIGDAIVLSPPLIISEEEISQIFEIIRESIRETK
ncbi:MAG: aspartate aminotransferase family protein [Gammaproteobacteria bacterium]|nr:aspartate aminotransferase family protein [Gammaproteobacteria bacterium]MBT4494241.1 aspartate aminotransferase family protein [Gammaproteobacteria bacterium]MBT7369833.1 aspartate aminotransferase family protein [Gammaproteobacteria bacterium]